MRNPLNYDSLICTSVEYLYHRRCDADVIPQKPPVKLVHVALTLVPS